ncbi:hypothetical protein L7F22_030380 [Adiantum nelumboides]|nr:hypothetical protein [Adiantum nelumboides]
MAMASPGVRVVPETSSSLMGRLNLSIIPNDCEDNSYGASSVEEKAEKSPSIHGPLYCAMSKAAHDHTPHNTNLISDSPSSFLSSYKGKLPVVLEESQSLSNREGSSVFEGSSSTSSLSIASSSASSTDALFRRGDKHRYKDKARGSWKHHRKRRDGKKVSFMSLLLWPLKKLRDGYMSCMMGLDGAGDLSGLAQGSTFATAAKHFGDVPVSKN